MACGLVVRARQRLEGWRIGPGTALLWGLGPLVRPELAIVSIVSVVAALVVCRPPRANALAIIGLGLLPGISYEVFRAGYFGVLVPNPAVAKEAGLSNWPQGLWYLGDLVAGYQLWVPCALVLVHVALRRGAGQSRSTRLIVMAQVCAGIVMAGYLVRVGGDFMHARLLLPSVFCLVLPVFAVTWDRRVPTAVVAFAMLSWACLAAVGLRPAYSGTETFHGIVDERSQLRTLRGDVPVVTVRDQERTNDAMLRAAAQADSDPPALVYVPYDGWRDGRFVSVPAASGRGGVLAAHALGVTSHIAADHQLYVQDLLGLADPVTAHYRLAGNRGRPGHEKWLPDAWIIARFGDRPRRSRPM